MSRIESAANTLRNLRETFESYRDGTQFNSWKFGSVARSTPDITLRVAKVDNEALERAEANDNPSEVVGTALFACPHCNEAHEVSINVAQLLAGICGLLEWQCSPTGSTFVGFGLLEHSKRGEKQ